MGSFYDNALVTASIERVVQILQAQGATGLAAAAGPGWTVVYPHNGFAAAALCRELDCSALLADVYDSDVLTMKIWNADGVIHEYCNNPTYFAEEFDDIDGIPHGRTGSDDAAARWVPVGVLGTETGPFTTFAIGEPDTDALLAALSNQPTDPEAPTHDGGYLFANELHWDAMAALGLPADLLTTGYIYLSRTDDPHTDYSALTPFGNAVRPDPAHHRSR